jgi:hypothetical protein
MARVVAAAAAWSLTTGFEAPAEGREFAPAFRVSHCKSYGFAINKPNGDPTPLFSVA